MKRLVQHMIVFAGLLTSVLLNAQTTDVTKTIEAIVESHLESTEDENNIGTIVEDLEFIAENPININSTNAAELSKLYVLDEVLIHNLLRYIEDFGPVYSMYELNTIDGFSPALLTQLQPFIFFGQKEERTLSLKEELKYGKHQLLMRTLGTLQKEKGYLKKEDGTTPYNGNGQRFYTRYRFESPEKISAGVTAEKDPGEAFFSGNNKRGFDFYSAHLSFNFNTFVEKITVGDFVVRSGQGLVLWQGYSNGKSLYTLDVSKTNQGIRPYTSVDENNFFRGFATSLHFGNGKLHLFYSQKNADANVVTTADGSRHFTSLQTSGYHRTANEIIDKNSVNDKNLGAVFNYSFHRLKIGATVHAQQFNLPFVPSPELYNLFRFQGKENITAGTDYVFHKGKYEFFGEAALSESGGKAFVQGAVARLNDRFGISGLFRHFDKNYQSLWANAFSEGSSTANETGFYLGAKILPVKFVTLSVYSDHYKSNWINFTTAGPAQGWDIFGQADFVFSRKFEFYLRYKTKEKDKKFKFREVNENLPERIQKIRWHVQLKPTEILTFKIRFETALYNGLEAEKGFLVFQDVQFSPERIPLNLSARFAWFATDSYNTRIYAYENDLLYSYSIPAYFGKGFKTYLNLKYSINNNMDCWFKIANTSWNDRETSGSGYNEIEGRHKTELKFQLRWKF